MNINDFDYNLPKELIAQVPLENRTASKLLVMDKKTGELTHEVFKNITKYLHKGDVLVLNNTKVIPARLIGEKEDTKAHIELLLLNDLGNNKYECLARPQKRLHVGTIVSFGKGLLKAKVLEIKGEGIVHVEFIYNGIFYEILDKLGEMPLPPYIHEKLKDKTRYNTVYAKIEGSAAAPTAGLHFTNELLDEIRNMGVIVTFVTLHVGLGTFRPVEEENVLDHKMHSEFYMMSKETADILNLAKKEKRRIITEKESQVLSPRKIMRFFKSPIAKRMLSSKFVKREQKIYTQIKMNDIYLNDEIFKNNRETYENESVMLRGVIDLYFEEDDGLVILDYKTDFVDENNKKEIIHKYKKQIEIYADVLSKLTGKKVKEKYLYLFGIDEQVKVD